MIVPAWNLYLLARRALVMSGFAMPKPAEVSPGLTTLGREGSYDIASALDNPAGVAHHAAAGHERASGAKSSPSSVVGAAQM